MGNIQNTFIARQLPTDFTWEGLILGGKTGFLLSMLYAIVGILVIEGLGQGMDLFSLLVVGEKWGENIGMLLMILMLIFLLVILPATFVGALTGMFLGYLAKHLVKMMQIHLYLAVAFSFCLIVTIGFHVWASIPVELSFQTSSSLYSFGVYPTYPFSVGIPSMIYMLTGVWVAWLFYSRAHGQIKGKL